MYILCTLLLLLLLLSLYDFVLDAISVLYVNNTIILLLNSQFFMFD